MEPNVLAETDVESEAPIAAAAITWRTFLLSLGMSPLSRLTCFSGRKAETVARGARSNLCRIGLRFG